MAHFGTWAWKASPHGLRLVAFSFKREKTEICSNGLFCHAASYDCGNVDKGNRTYRDTWRAIIGENSKRSSDDDVESAGNLSCFEVDTTGIPHSVSRLSLTSSS